MFPDILFKVNFKPFVGLKKINELFVIIKIKFKYAHSPISNRSFTEIEKTQFRKI
jgi:hypothetical protein